MGIYVKKGIYPDLLYGVTFLPTGLGLYYPYILVRIFSTFRVISEI